MRKCIANAAVEISRRRDEVDERPEYSGSDEPVKPDVNFR